MPDYNPEDIPTLDDIIEKDVSENADSDDAKTEATKNEADLFSDNSIDQDTDDTVSDEIEPQPGDLNDIVVHENNGSIIDLQPVEATEQVSIEPISLELMVNDIVKQLMPDLEQQLKSLLQQALEEKLPEELIKSTDTAYED